MIILFKYFVNVENYRSFRSFGTKIILFKYFFKNDNDEFEF